MVSSKPTTTTLWGVFVTIAPNAEGKYPCPVASCGRPLSKGALRNHIVNLHPEPPPEDGSTPEPSPRGRAQTLRRASLPYPKDGRSRSRSYTSSPLARSASPFDPEGDAGPVPPVALQPMQWEPTAPGTSQVISVPVHPGRTVNTETVRVTIVQSTLLRDFELVVLQPYGLLACVSCGWGFGHDHASGHLLATHHTGTLKGEIVRELVDQYHLKTTEELLGCKPTGIVPAFPILSTVPGFACTGCDFMAGSEEVMSKHLRTHPKGSVSSEAASLQLFLPARHGGYIHVQPPIITVSKSTSDLVNETIALDRETYEPPLVDNTDWRTLHPFLEISGWGRWMGNMRRRDVDAMRLKLKASPELISDCRALIQTMWKCCTAENYAARCHINSLTCVSRS
jgi:hypothetical protein